VKSQKLRVSIALKTGCTAFQCRL